MNVILSPEVEQLIERKVQSGEYRSPEEVINAAVRLLQERDEDCEIVRAVGALAVDDDFENRVKMLLHEAEQSGPATEMTEDDWADIRCAGKALLDSRTAR